MSICKNEIDTDWINGHTKLKKATYDTFLQLVKEYHEAAQFPFQGETSDVSEAEFVEDMIYYMSVTLHELYPTFPLSKVTLYSSRKEMYQFLGKLINEYNMDDM